MQYDIPAPVSFEELLSRDIERLNERLVSTAGNIRSECDRVFGEALVQKCLCAGHEARYNQSSGVLYVERVEQPSYCTIPDEVSSEHILTPAEIISLRLSEEKVIMASYEQLIETEDDDDDDHHDDANILQIPGLTISSPALLNGRIVCAYEDEDSSSTIFTCVGLCDHEVSLLKGAGYTVLKSNGYEINVQWPTPLLSETWTLERFRTQVIPAGTCVTNAALLQAIDRALVAIEERGFGSAFVRVELREEYFDDLQAILTSVGYRLFALDDGDFLLDLFGTARAGDVRHNGWETHVLYGHPDDLPTDDTNQQDGSGHDL